MRKRLTRAEIREALKRPLSHEEMEEMRRADRADAWLLRLSFLELNKQNEEDEPANNGNIN